jgi:hypothetical protein
MKHTCSRKTSTPRPQLTRNILDVVFIACGWHPLDVFEGINLEAVVSRWIARGNTDEQDIAQQGRKGYLRRRVVNEFFG